MPLPPLPPRRCSPDDSVTRIFAESDLKNLIRFMLTKYNLIDDEDTDNQILDHLVEWVSDNHNEVGIEVKKLDLEQAIQLLITIENAK